MSIFRETQQQNLCALRVLCVFAVKKRSAPVPPRLPSVISTTVGRRSSPFFPPGPLKISTLRARCRCARNDTCKSSPTHHGFSLRSLRLCVIPTSQPAKTARPLTCHSERPPLHVIPTPKDVGERHASPGCPINRYGFSSRPLRLCGKKRSAPVPARSSARFLPFGHNVAALGMTPANRPVPTKVFLRVLTCTCCSCKCCVFDMGWRRRSERRGRFLARCGRI